MTHTHCNTLQPSINKAATYLHVHVHVYSTNCSTLAAYLKRYCKHHFIFLLESVSLKVFLGHLCNLAYAKISINESNVDCDILCYVYAKIFSLKQTIHVHEATLVAHEKATLLFVCAAHEISHVTFYTYKSLGNTCKRMVYFQATCRE